MSIASLMSILETLRGEELDPEHKRQLMYEVLLLTLARASSADSEVEAIEISAVRRAIKEAIDIDVSEADVRSAANSEIFEAVSLETALTRLSTRLTDEDRMSVVTKLGDVIRSDSRVRQTEIDYFDRVVRALRIPPSVLLGMAGLVSIRGEAD